MTVERAAVFISYAGPDQSWAEWVAWHLHEAGHEVELDVWDWAAGDNFVARMDEALERATVVVALFSRSYFEIRRWTQEEWTSVVARRGRVVPLVVEPLDGARIPAILAPVIRRELHGVEEGKAVAVLLEAVDGPRRPQARPAFPGASVPPAPARPVGVPDHRPRMPRGEGLPSPESLFRTAAERTEAQELARAPRGFGSAVRPTVKPGEEGAK
ncbi:toll/interleukin-1 receptor domain-containing protein [Streptomyces humi]